MVRKLKSWISDRFYFVLLGRLLLTTDNLRVLDIGCGNNTPSITKQRFPGCVYTGIDCVENSTYSLDSQAALDSFFKCDLSRGDLPDKLTGPFDLIIMSHVIEHLKNGLEISDKFCQLLAPGGLIYIEWPAMRSMHFPSMEGSLNFWDDPTHVRLYSLREIANVMMANNLRIKKLGTRRFGRRIVFSPFIFLFHILRKGRPRGTSLWDLLGFAEYALAQAPDNTLGNLLDLNESAP